MRRREVIVGLLGVTMLMGASAAAAQPVSAYTLTLYPSEVRPGGEIRVELQSQDVLDPCGGMATSPGFVAPIELQLSSHTVHSGTGQVITKPGVYQVTVSCPPGGSVTQTFTITGGPSTTPKPPATAPRPKRVTPVGAPETGGGGTA
ncbi:phage tail tube protein [Kutzneria kofuensis]|uniref:Uncharacterized protein n=1 Tax=Kutzneria kofuensis TaxID=103725 RepID=A0A7W9KS32_9PSEU|nr:phage tail tube protein [Kutzneria kofuensis]MBB5897690.1 hypothetical protein [Kutzneria kofuensis]